MPITAWMDRVFYPHFENNWDDDRFRLEIVSLLKPHFHCLDYGAGRGHVRQLNFKGMVDFVAGVDPDRAVLSNAYVDEAVLLPPNGGIPYEDESFDLVYSANVLEHVEDPERAFREIARVLRPGALFLAKTPNRNHYIALIARMTPTRFHEFYNGLRGRSARDTFETYYRCNSPRQIRKYQELAGFELHEISLWEGRPEYLRIFWPFYLFGLLYERMVNAFDLLAPLRSVMVVRMRKADRTAFWKRRRQAMLVSVMQGREVMRMSRAFRAGVIGCGFFAGNHLHAWKQIEDVDLVAVCDLDRAKAEAAAATHGVASVYHDAEAMLASEDLDFVDIVTTMPTHRALAELAAAHHVPMIVQKPFAPTIEDCRAIVRAAAGSAVPLMVHENFRFQTPIRAVKEVLDSGVIGQPFFGRIAWRTAFDVYANQPYLAEEERFLLLDLVIHLFDVDRYLFGEVSELTCRTQSIKPGIKGEDAATILLGHDDGVTSVVDATYSSRRDPDPFPETLIEVDGTEGSVRLDHGCRLTVVSPSGTERRTVEPVLLPWAEKPWHGIQESVLRTQEHWVDCLRAGHEPDTSGADNLKTYALAEAAYASAAGGGIVDPRDFA